MADGIIFTEVWKPEAGQEHIKIARWVFKLTRNGQLIKSAPDCDVHQIAIPVAELVDLSEQEQDNLVKATVRDYIVRLDANQVKIEERLIVLTSLDRFKGYEMDEKDTGNDKPVKKPTVDPKEAELP